MYQSVGVLAIFFLGMLTHPAVEAKAQEEIDRVVGKNRLPTFEDRVNMPYIEAVFKEAFRWHTLAPLSLPHVCTKDDICEGYLIPKDAIIVPNSWFVLSLEYMKSSQQLHVNLRVSIGGFLTTPPCTRIRRHSIPPDIWDPILPRTL